MYYVITHRWYCDPQLVEHTDEEPWTEQVICKGICVFLTIWRVSIPKTPTLFKVQLCFKFIDQFGENWNFNNDEPYDLWSLHISTLMYNFLRFLSLVLFLAIVHSFVPDSLLPHGLQHARLPYPSLSTTVCSNSCLLSQWCHRTISSYSVTPFSSCPQSFPVSGSFLTSHLFTKGGQSIEASASASVLLMTI